MTAVRLIQVPYYLGREHADLSRGPAKLADAIEGDGIVIQPPRPNVLPNSNRVFAAAKKLSSNLSLNVSQ